MTTTALLLKEVLLAVVVATVMLAEPTGSRLLPLPVVWQRMKSTSHCPAQIRPLLETVIGESGLDEHAC